MKYCTNCTHDKVHVYVPALPVSCASAILDLHTHKQTAEQSGGSIYIILFLVNSGMYFLSLTHTHTHTHTYTHIHSNIPVHVGCILW